MRRSGTATAFLGSFGENESLTSYFFFKLALGFRIVPSFGVLSTLGLLRDIVLNV